VNPYLPKSGSWIHSQIAGLERYRPVVVTKRVENLDSFPVDTLYTREELSAPNRLYQRLAKRWGRPYFPFYRDALAKEGAALLHSHFGNWGYEDIELAQDLGIPQVTSFYGADIWRDSQDPEWRARYHRYFAESQLFLVEGNAMRKKVMELGCPSEKVVVQHLGVPLERIGFEPRALASPQDPVRYLVAGRIMEKKGHDMAIRAFGRVHRENPRTHLHLMLIRPERRVEEVLGPLERLIAESGAADAITLHDAMPYQEYLDALRSFHVFLAPSRHAADGDAEGGAPVTIIEMSASGMPVIASSHCDLPEVVVNGETGLVFPEGDEDALVGAMLEFAAEPERWPGFAQAGRAYVEAEYNARTQARRLEEIYDGLLAR